jgi:hypothetical protein
MQRGKENGTLTCTIWLSVGPVGVFALKRKDANDCFAVVSETFGVPAPQ